MFRALPSSSSLQKVWLHTLIRGSLEALTCPASVGEKRFTCRNNLGFCLFTACCEDSHHFPGILKPKFTSCSGIAKDSLPRRELEDGGHRRLCPSHRLPACKHTSRVSTVHGDVGPRINILFFHSYVISIISLILELHWFVSLNMNTSTEWPIVPKSLIVVPECHNLQLSITIIRSHSYDDRTAPVRSLRAFELNNWTSGSKMTWPAKSCDVKFCHKAFTAG